MAHEWYIQKSRNPLDLIAEFDGFRFDTDYGGTLYVSSVKMLNKIFPSHDEAENYITDYSYGGETAYMAAYTTKKLSRGYQNAHANFLMRYNEYLKFEEDLTIAYGRKASKVTCPECGSSINLKYGNGFKMCPVCGSRKIISDSNWKTLETKKKMYEKAAENLSKEAEKNDVMFICGIEWHC